MRQLDTRCWNAVHLRRSETSSSVVVGSVWCDELLSVDSINPVRRQQRDFAVDRQMTCRVQHKFAECAVGKNIIIIMSFFVLPSTWSLSGCKGVRCPPIFTLSNLINVGWLVRKCVDIYIHPLIAGTNRKAFCCMLALRWRTVTASDH